MMKTALLATLLISPTLAADVPAPSAPIKSAPLALLEDSFGAPGVETLAARGVLVLQGKPGARRLAAVHWKAFAALTRAAGSCLALTAAADALGHEAAAPKAPSLDLAACRALPVDGLMTPSLHALAAALEAGHEERWALHRAAPAAAIPPPADAPGRANLFDTARGKDLIARHHADALENPASLAKPVFDDMLAGPRPDKEAVALFAAEAAARGASSYEILFAYDAAHGTLSEELRAQLRHTLANERSRWAAAKARAAAADLLGQASVKRELSDLRNTTSALSSRPNLPALLEAAAGGAASAPGGARLKSAGLHLQEPTRLGQHELGDWAIVSGAYWVDGLKENESVEVEETLVVETERGFPSIETRAYKRRNGGPYPFAWTVKITETRSFAVRSLISAGGFPIAERVEVPLARDFELALVMESGAASLRTACRLKDAEDAYLALETLVEGPAKVKPQYKDIVLRARKAREASKSDAATLMKLEEALPAVRADSAPQLCRYETGRIEGALKLARLLPAGCDRALPELHALRATIMRRAADQNWFMKASSEARSKRKSCDLDAARELWSEALASLDADPGARCGRVAEEEGRAKTDFAELTRKIAWREEFGKSLAKAEAETAPTRRLEILRPVTSRLGALNADCFNAEQRRAAALSGAASKMLTAPADNETTRLLPLENALAATVIDIRRERARRLEAASAVEKASVEMAVTPAAEAPKAAVLAPAFKPAAKKPVKRPKRKTKEAAVQ